MSGIKTHIVRVYFLPVLFLSPTSQLFFFSRKKNQSYLFLYGFFFFFLSVYIIISCRISPELNWKLSSDPCSTHVSLCPQRPHGQLTDGKARPFTDAHLLSRTSLPRQNTWSRHGTKQLGQQNRGNTRGRKALSYMKKKEKNVFNHQKFLPSVLSRLSWTHEANYFLCAMCLCSRNY